MKPNQIVFALAPILLIVSVLFVVGLLGSDEDDSSHPPLATDLVGQCRAVLDSLQLEIGFPGATAAFILPDGSVRGLSTGLADLENEEPMNPEHLMLAGSVGKIFVAGVALDLVCAGVLDLDVSIAEYLGDEPWFRRLPHGREITLRQLLSHTAGVTDHLAQPEFQAAVAEMIAAVLEPGGDPDRCLSHDEILDYILAAPEPESWGERVAYADAHYILVGLIIEKVTDGSFYEEARRRLLVPLDLPRTTPSDHRELPELAAGYATRDNPFGISGKVASDGVMNHNPALEWTGGGFATNPQDLVRWARLFYTGRALPCDYVDEVIAQTPWDPDGGYEAYGLATIIHTSPVGRWYGHSGWYPGYNSFVAYYPEQGFAVAVQVNRDSDTGVSEIGTRLAALVAAHVAETE